VASVATVVQGALGNCSDRFAVGIRSAEIGTVVGSLSVEAGKVAGIPSVEAEAESRSAVVVARNLSFVVEVQVEELN
jgi:hypothetical protein